MGLTYVTRTLTFLSMDGISYSMTYLEASNGTKGPFRFEKWYECPTCSMDFPESQTAIVKGTRYGVPCGCYKDGD
jgi:hypothetical protein